jgi:type II secretory pathway pseudopilin PulG
MTSTLTIGPEQQRLEGRTLRDIVEYDPTQVNEVWCRKIFRQLLQSLEVQHAMQMPHRAITPDTVVFHDNGDPLLLPSDIPVPESEQDEAADLTALARVVHFAITRELAPAGPLHGRALDGYSESLLTAVDRCMASDPAERPRTIDELRHILGIVSLGPVAPAGGALAPAFASELVPESAPESARSAIEPAPAADALPSFMREEPAAKPGPGLSRWQRRALVAGAAAALLAVALALFAELRDSGSYDHIVLTLPQSGADADAGNNARPAPPAAPAPGPASAPLAAQDQPQAGTADPASQTPADGGAPTAQTANAPAAQDGAAPALPPAAPLAAQAVPNAAAPGSATYRLHIQPWGVVYVDGIDRGVSPPVKRLALAPGKHTIRITNPNFRDRVFEVDSRSGANGQIAANFNAHRQVRTNP